MAMFGSNGANTPHYRLYGYTWKYTTPVLFLQFCIDEVV